MPVLITEEKQVQGALPGLVEPFRRPGKTGGKRKIEAGRDHRLKTKKYQGAVLVRKRKPPWKPWRCNQHSNFCRSKDAGTTETPAGEKSRNAGCARVEAVKEKKRKPENGSFQPTAQQNRSGRDHRRNKRRKAKMGEPTAVKPTPAVASQSRIERKATPKTNAATQQPVVKAPAVKDQGPAQKATKGTQPPAVPAQTAGGNRLQSPRGKDPPIK